MEQERLSDPGTQQLTIRWPRYLTCDLTMTPVPDRWPYVDHGPIQSHHHIVSMEINHGRDPSSKRNSLHSHQDPLWEPFLRYRTRTFISFLGRSTRTASLIHQTPARRFGLCTYLLILIEFKYGCILYRELTNIIYSHWSPWTTLVRPKNMMCYRFRIISEIRSNNEFSSGEIKTTAIRMNTKMLNAFLLFSRKRNNEMSWNFHRLVLLHISWFL